jgi:hypothetical protein
MIFLLEFDSIGKESVVTVTSFLRLDFHCRSQLLKNYLLKKHILILGQQFHHDLLVEVRSMVVDRTSEL